MAKKEIKKQNRAGDTITSSVSISKEFQKIIDEQEISPTEAFRRGVAVMCYDAGLEQYFQISKKRVRGIH